MALCILPLQRYRTSKNLLLDRIHSQIPELLKFTNCQLALVKYLLCGNTRLRIITDIVSFYTAIAGRIVTSKDVFILIPEFCKCVTLYSKSESVSCSVMSLFIPIDYSLLGPSVHGIL